MYEFWELFLHDAETFIGAILITAFTIFGIYFMTKILNQ